MGGGEGGGSSSSPNSMRRDLLQLDLGEVVFCADGAEQGPGD
jgi:hypothetical protein